MVRVEMRQYLFPLPRQQGAGREVVHLLLVEVLREDDQAAVREEPIRPASGHVEMGLPGVSEQPFIEEMPCAETLGMLDNEHARSTLSRRVVDPSQGARSLGVLR